MGLSIADMRKSPAAALPTRAYKLCLAQSLVARVQSLEDEKATLTIEDARDDEGNRAGPPRRNSDGPDPRIAEIDAELESLYDEMREHTGELRLRGIASGEWRRWVDANPARKDNRIDEMVASETCNADALLADLERYVVSWNGDDLGEGDWEFIANRAAPGDLKTLCSMVVGMHEGLGVSAPGKSQRPSSETPVSETE